MGQWVDEMEKGEMGEQPRDSEQDSVSGQGLVGSLTETANAEEKATWGKRIYVQIW